jgi:acetyl-CoA carboxylase biotin carboxyl carrier protein
MSRVEVRSEIPGSVVSIDAAVGDALAEDDPVITVESMKMWIPIPAPIAGRVTEIRMREGDAVATGQVVAVIET